MLFLPCHPSTVPNIAWPLQHLLVWVPLPVEEDGVLFRIVYQDGDSEDSSLEELEEAYAHYTSIKDDLD